MRRVLLGLPFALALTTAAPADEVTDLRDRALKAAAKDPADIQKFKLYTLRAKGTSKLSGEPVPANFELTAVYPSKLKATWEFGMGEGKQFTTICGSDDKGWKRGTAFTTIELSVEELNDFRTDVYGVFASTLLTLTEPETKLSLVPRTKVGSDPVVGLKLSRRPYPEVTLLFDEKTFALRQMSYRGRENGIVLSKEMTFGGHKEIGGLTLPTTQTMFVQQKEVYTWTEMNFEFPDKLDGKTFDKP